MPVLTLSCADRRLFMNCSKSYIQLHISGNFAEMPCHSVVFFIKVMYTIYM